MPVTVQICGARGGAALAVTYSAAGLPRTPLTWTLVCPTPLATTVRKPLAQTLVARWVVFGDLLVWMLASRHRALARSRRPTSVDCTRGCACSERG